MSRGLDDTLAESAQSDRSEIVRPSFAEALRFWLKLGFVSFGGPSGQIAIMQTELVDRKRWITQTRFLHALNYCMLLPGPEATQLAIYIGWVLHRTAGGVVAGALFVIPSMFILWGLSFVYAAYGSIPWIAAVFYGFKPVVAAIVAVALIRIGRRALKNEVLYAIAAMAFIGLFFFKVPFPIIILGAGLIGFVGGKLWPSKFDVISEQANKSLGQDSHEALTAFSTAHTRPRLNRDIRIAICCLAVWWLPVVLAAILLGPQHSIFQEGIFFSK